VVLSLIINTHLSAIKTYVPCMSPTYVFSQHHLAKVVKRIVAFHSSVDQESVSALSTVDFDYYFTFQQEFVEHR